MESTGLASRYLINFNYYQICCLLYSRNISIYQTISNDLKQLDVQVDVKISTGDGIFIKYLSTFLQISIGCLENHNLLIL